MRLLSLVVVGWVSVAFAQVAAPPPPPAIQAEMATLEKEVMTGQAQNKPFEAVRAARKLDALTEKYIPAGSQLAQRRAVTFTTLLNQTGDYTTAVRVHARLVAATESTFGAESREMLSALQSANGSLWLTLDYDAIEPVQRRILALSKKFDGEASLSYINNLSTYALVLAGRNEHGASLRTFEEVLRLHQVIAKDETDLMMPLLTVASVAWQSGQRGKAMPLLERVVKLAEKKAATSPAMATAAITGASYVYAAGGRMDLATPLRHRAIAMLTAEYTKAKAKPDDVSARSLAGQISNLYSVLDDQANAETWLQTVVEAEKKTTGFSLYEALLADLKRMQGKNSEALALYENVQKAVRALNPESSEGYTLTIVEILRDLKQFARAEKLITEYLARQKKKFGERSTAYVWPQLTAAGVMMSSNQPAKAEAILGDALERSEKQLAAVLGTGSEADHSVFFARSMNQLDLVMNYAREFGATRPGARRLGLTTLLRRKGRVLDAAAANLAKLRTVLSPEDKKLLDELASARSTLARLTLVGPGGDEPAFAKEVARLEEQIAKLDVEVGRRSASYRARTQPITLAGVQAQLPAGTKLVEFVNYSTYDPRAPLVRGRAIKRAYAAFVVGKTGDPAMIDLGEAAPIDSAIEKLRVALSNPKDTTVQARGRALYDLTIAKLRPALGKSTDLLVAPDGALNVVPFAALVDEGGAFLVEKYTFTYLTSGRDLLRLALKTKAQGGGVMFADPAFNSGGTPDANAPATRGARSSELVGLVWPPLPGTAAEADGVEKAMKLSVFRKEKATESALKSVKGPRVLHLATHGFFLPDAPDADGGTMARSAAAPAYVPQVSSGAAENPLLRSGLALAGADSLSSGTDDGILTALEATGLDLGGTQLVVLSACETGVGKVTNGDGVYGLRRALVIAGAESLVMSLWQVDDEATRELMVGYYTRLGKKAPRSSALRDVQLEIAHQPKYQHPYYWASFVPAGANRPLE